MQTEHILITDPTEQATDIRRAACIIRTGGLVVFPTETVYGLGGDATNADASRRIYAAKGRPSDNPLIIHVASPQDAAMYADTDALYDRLAKAFMPGPLTVIMPRKPIIPLSTTGGLETVAVRCPSHPVAHALIAAAGVPIAAPSANLSGKPSPTCAAHVAQDMDGRVEMILDGGDCEIGLESTIVKLDRDGDGEFLTLLRPGGITYDALCCVCERVAIAPAVTELLSADVRPLSPGMKYKHYAPATPVVLLGVRRSTFCRTCRSGRRPSVAPSCATMRRSRTCYREDCFRSARGMTLLPMHTHCLPACGNQTVCTPMLYTPTCRRARGLVWRCTTA